MAMNIKSVILAAGMGTRLGLPEPKPLTPLRGSATILDQQRKHLEEFFRDDLDLHLVVGHMAERFDFLRGSVGLHLNPRFQETNTSKSLLVALDSIPQGPVLWMNGDVVFKDGVLDRCAVLMSQDKSFIMVNRAHTDEEEVKYTLDDSGAVATIGKNIDNALGEAVGINFVSSSDRPNLRDALEAVEDQDYFEAGIQLLLSAKTARFEPVFVDLSDAIEVDTKDDLKRARDGFDYR